MRTNRFLAGLALTLIAPGCGPRIDLEAEQAALLELQAQERRAHLEKRADLLVEVLDDDFMHISRGRVEQPPKEANRQRIQAYFDRSSFLEWDDIVPPRVHISPDGQMAWLIVEKRVRLTAPDSLGVQREESTRFAWMETWEKRDGTWRLQAVASTDDGS